REVMLGDAPDQALDPTAVVDPSAGRLVEGRWDVDADPPVARAGVEVEGRGLLALLAAAVGLAAGAMLEHERPAGQRPARPGFGPRASSRRAAGKSAGNEVS